MFNSWRDFLRDPEGFNPAVEGKALRRQLFRRNRSEFSIFSASSVFIAVLVSLLVTSPALRTPITVWLATLWIALFLFIALACLDRTIVMFSIRNNEQSNLLNLLAFSVLLGVGFPLVSASLGLLLKGEAPEWSRLLVAVRETYSLNGLVGQGIGGALKEAWDDPGKLIQLVAGLGVCFAIGIEGLRAGLSPLSNTDFKRSAVRRLMYGDTDGALAALDKMRAEDMEAVILRVGCYLLSDSADKARTLVLRRLSSELSRFPHSPEFSASMLTFWCALGLGASSTCLESAGRSLLESIEREEEWLAAFFMLVGAKRRELEPLRRDFSGTLDRNNFIFAMFLHACMNDDHATVENVRSKLVTSSSISAPVTMFVRSLQVAAVATTEGGQADLLIFLNDLLLVVSRTRSGGLIDLFICMCALRDLRGRVDVREPEGKTLCDKIYLAAKEHLVLLPYGQSILAIFRDERLIGG